MNLTPTALPSSIFSELFFMAPLALKSRPRLVAQASLPGSFADGQTTADRLKELKQLYGIADTIIENGVAILPVNGIMIQDAAPIDCFYGFCGYNEIERELAAAAANPDVKAVVLDISSPGGQATGANELASLVSAYSKPVVAFTDSLACSAAYYVAAAAQAIYASPSAIIGSIGTYMLLYDFSEYLAELGIKPELFASGKFKGAGAFGTSLTDDQKMQYQEVVMELAGQFKDFVGTRRPRLAAGNMEGQAFVGATACREHLVDALGTLATAKAEALGLANRVTP